MKELICWKAPLREDISSALVQVAKMDENCSMLLDPFCGRFLLHVCFVFCLTDGSGTIVIEAALLLKRAKRRARLIGGDRDEGAIEMARRNAERAGVADMCEFLCQSFSESLKIASKETVVVVTHPPFGLRTKADRGHLSNLYSGFLERLKDLTQLKDCVILVNDLQLIRSCRVEERFRTRSGGIPVAAVSIEKWSESRKD
jgi:23S rRNA G2445 N2-methylase RlmL